ncbi:hypothetical protein M434DRAFT_65164 [Hypoxylon sp. CO27-5]|nr:hypothetical protein M434DRAFT_65164 [Hypoxylon sp. CO27-5]
MNNLYVIRGPLCRSLLARPPHILKRCKFSGRTKTADKPKTGSLPDTPARTRFAPSPTGYVHIGSLRTALYSYLLAKATGGQFLLRIEDTDRARIVPDAETRLYEDLKWVGLSWDEGTLYKKHAEQLLNEGRAYRCFCTPAHLDRMRSISIQEGKPTTYNGTCSHIPPDVSARRAANGEWHCVRFKSDGQRPLVTDLVYRRYVKPEPEDDFVIIKRDGYPTYHFANVVDDHLMEITHVIRGAEWLVSTPRHVVLYDAFGWQKPQFAHLGLLVNQDKQKLSKRHGDVDIASWRDRGILPITLLNYVMLLGWSLGKGVRGQQEVMDLDEMVSKFHLGFTKGDITVNDKHEFLQKAHVKRITKSLGPEGVSNIVLPAVEAHVRKYEEQRRSGSASADSIVAELGPLKNLDEIRAIRPKEVIDDAASSSPFKSEKLRVSDFVATLRDLLQKIGDERWTKDAIEVAILPFIKSVYATTNSANSESQAWGYHLLRWVIAASKPGPALIPSMALLGKEETMRRIEKAYEIARSMEL